MTDGGECKEVYTGGRLKVAVGEARPWKVTYDLINIVRVPARVSFR